MRGDELLEKMELVDPAYVEAADAPRPKRRVRWTKWGAAACAAALVVAIVAVAVLPRNEEHSSLSSGAAQQQAQEGSSLPILTISEGANQGMGFEGYMAYDVSKIISVNPWTEDSQISELPVYKNPLEYHSKSPSMLIGGIDVERMREQLLNVAERLGLDTSKLEVKEVTKSEQELQDLKEWSARNGEEIPAAQLEPSQLVIETEGMRLDITPDLTTSIFFEPMVQLPEEYHIDVPATEEGYMKLAHYLQEAYGELIEFESPKAEVDGGDYTYDGQRLFHYVSFFDASETAEEAIINYNFDRVIFYVNEGKGLTTVRVYATDQSQKVGDYPLITVDEAKEKLAEGAYKSTVPAAFPGLDYVARTELIYRTGRYETYFMPYYRFLVEMPEMVHENGLKTYGAFYVPAVEEEYLSDQIVWDGRFN